MLVGRALKNLQREIPNLDIEEVDVVANPLTSWRAGIRMIPTLVKGEHRLSGVLLSEKQIRDFLSTP